MYLLVKLKKKLFIEFTLQIGELIWEISDPLSQVAGWIINAFSGAVTLLF